MKEQIQQKQKAGSNGHNHAYMNSQNQKNNKGLTWKRLFGHNNPYSEIQWEKRTAKIVRGNGEVVFEQKDVEVPAFWSQTATDIVASKYFKGQLGTPNREWSARQIVDRVADTISGWGWTGGYFNSVEDHENFKQDLKWILINQYAAFNSPVWFNVGISEKAQCSACQPYRALVSTPRGFIKIGDIVKHNLIGLPVYDSNGVTKVVAVKNNGHKKVFRVSLRNGSFIEATGDHLIRAAYKRRAESDWIRLDNLKKGMRLHLHTHKPIEKRKTFDLTANQSIQFAGVDGQVFQHNSSAFSKPADTNWNESSKEVSEAALAGWLQADGFVGKYDHGTNRSLTMEFIIVNDEEREWVESHLNVVFPNVHRKVRITETKAGTPITRIRLYGQPLSDFVAKYDLLKRRKEIRVPDIIWASGFETISAYVKSVFQSEGYVRIDNNSAHLAIATISQRWMEDIQILLFSLGIYSRLRTKVDKRENRENLTELDISIGSERRKFFDLVGFIDTRKQGKLEESLGLNGLKNIGSLREEEIVSIDLVGEEEVFDIQTQSGEYLSNNVVVHNCFILAVEDNMHSIINWVHDEGWIFKYGSGAGVNLSKLRSSKEPLSKGGYSSGPVSFMKAADGMANAIRSGGTTRRAAKMVVLNVDHPDIKDFIYSKKIIEDMTKVLQTAGINDSIEANLFDPYALLPYQNANNSVRTTDDFMKAVKEDGDWDLKAVTTGEPIETVKAGEVMDWIADAAWYSADPGMQYDTTINDWHTCPNSGRINASNPCSEYVHLDNSSCNLASINLLKYLKADGTFNVEQFKKTVDVMILAQDMLIDEAHYPTEKIGQNSRDYRQLGLGYSNLGALLMAMGLPYDSDAGRAVAGSVTSLLCGEAYNMSARISNTKEPFAGYAKNKEPMLRVIKKHTKAADDLADDIQNRKLCSDYELVVGAKDAWHKALELGSYAGFRNSQATVIAPTGTISFLMDCATTGIEPDLALVKYKKLVGGGTLRLVNNQVPIALRNLGYNEDEIDEINKYILENDTIENAPHLKEEHLPVFDCSFKAQNGTRSIGYMGHLKMMAVAQPFVSGAISKTVNLPERITREEIKDVYIEAWKLGLKAVALYRDGSKTVQPMSTQKDNKMIEHVNGYTRVKLPDERASITHKFSIAGHEGYLTVGMYPETNKPGETFIVIAKEGSTVSGLFDTIATLLSMCLQSGVPLKTLVQKFKGMRFEPAGVTSNSDIPMAKSFIDYIVTYLGHKFLSEDEKRELGLINGDNHGNGNGNFKVEVVDSKKEDVQLKDNPKLVTADVVTTDAPICECGAIMARAGSCYTCPNCFYTTGVCN